MNKQPEALRLAEWLDHYGDKRTHSDAAAELRRLHNRVITLTAQHYRDDEAAAELRRQNDRINTLEAALRQVQKPVAWVYAEGLQALKSGKPWVAYGTDGDRRIPLYLHNDAVAPRVEPRASESGAGFESLPASPPTEKNT